MFHLSVHLLISARARPRLAGSKRRTAGFWFYTYSLFRRRRSASDGLSLNPRAAQALSSVSRNAGSRAFLTVKCHFARFQLSGPYTAKPADCTELRNVSASAASEPHRHLWSLATSFLSIPSSSVNSGCSSHQS